MTARAPGRFFYGRAGIRLCVLRMGSTDCEADRRKGLGMDLTSV